MSEIAPEQAAPEAATPETDAAPAEEWSGVDRESWESTQQTLQETREALEYMAGLMQPAFPSQQQTVQQPVQIDPLDDNFQGQLDQYIEQRLAPYSEYVQAQQFREGEARAQDILSDIKARDGDFVFDGSTKVARDLANSYIGAMNQQYPNDPAQAAEAALEAAAKDVREWETSVGKAYHDQQINQLGQLSGARRDLPAGAVNGSQQFTVPQGGTLVDVAYRHGGEQ